MNTLTQRLLAALPLALVAACGSSPPSSASNSDAMVYASSARSPSSIANCLRSHLSSAYESHSGNATELAIGSRSDASYFVTLTPNGRGSVIRVTHGASSSNDPPEEELRFDVARCTT
ncbi:sugar ABC transporter ATPase [Paraburkholderia sp. J63]|uniref:sugar ABC transporter ATPase n=1 Tax=Paraburkholderia sp. J63 TaxID=2805434 RepID=UPI002ABDCD97|nr:sugar ABC transporter ATPase [Paraburkholderia sp. J63]